MADNAEVILRRCLYCQSTKANPILGGDQGWFSLDVKTGRVGPFCTPECATAFADWPPEAQLNAIYGTFKNGAQFLAALVKGTCLPDSPLLYPRQIEGQGELLIGPGETYVIGWVGGSFASESFPTFEATPYEVPA